MPTQNAIECLLRSSKKSVPADKSCFMAEEKIPGFLECAYSRVVQAKEQSISHVRVL